MLRDIYVVFSNTGGKGEGRDYILQKSWNFQDDSNIFVFGFNDDDLDFLTVFEDTHFAQRTMQASALLSFPPPFQTFTALLERKKSHPLLCVMQVYPD